MKCSRHKELTFRSLQNRSVNVYKNTQERVSFPKNENFDNQDIACSDFITRVEYLINTIASCKTVRVKNNGREWLDEEGPEKIHIRNKLYKKI